MSDGSIEEVHVLKRFLHWFEIVSGLKINYSKCEMLGLRMDANAVSAFCFSFGCKVKSLNTRFRYAFMHRYAEEDFVGTSDNTF